MMATLRRCMYEVKHKQWQHRKKETEESGSPSQVNRKARKKRPIISSTKNKKPLVKENVAKEISHPGGTVAQPAPVNGSRPLRVPITRERTGPFDALPGIPISIRQNIPPFVQELAQNLHNQIREWFHTSRVTTLLSPSISGKSFGPSCSKYIVLPIVNTNASMEDDEGDSIGLSQGIPGLESSKILRKLRFRMLFLLLTRSR